MMPVEAELETATKIPNVDDHATDPELNKGAARPEDGPLFHVPGVIRLNHVAPSEDVITRDVPVKFATATKMPLSGDQHTPYQGIS
jgi:hypothetical protein